jgi:hypothetical protein
MSLEAVCLQTSSRQWEIKSIHTPHAPLDSRRTIRDPRVLDICLSHVQPFK